MTPPTKLSYPIDLTILDRDIRPMPATASKIVALCNCNDTKVAEITQLIECEPAIAVKLLAMANSPLYGASREVTSVNHAIVLLGYKAVAQLALMIATGPLFITGDPSLMDHRRQLFRESLGVATVSKLLADRLNLADSSEAFLGGMMLDIGKLYYFDMLAEPYLEILEQNGGEETVHAEQQVFGADHPTIGNRFGQKWGLPAKINELIKNHHLEVKQLDEGLTQAVTAGIYFARKWGIGIEQQGFQRCDEMESRYADYDMAALGEVAAEHFQAVKTVFAI